MKHIKILQFLVSASGCCTFLLLVYPGLGSVEAQGTKVITEKAAGLTVTATNEKVDVNLQMQDPGNNLTPGSDLNVPTTIIPKNKSKIVTRGRCGDLICDRDNGETILNCPADCGSYCGDAICNSVAVLDGKVETPNNCPQDCGSCPNSVCDLAENCTTCPQDCQTGCGDHCIGPNETCQSCPMDVGPCPIVCGAYGCQAGETSANCPSDCPICDNNGICSGGETCSSCAADCGICATCFVGGTLITMSDGSRKTIETIKAGDHILAFDERTKQFKPDKVTKTLRHTSPGYLLVNGRLKVTGNHPVLSNGRWIHIGKLKAGDTLLNEKGEAEVIKTMETVKGNITTYNFEVNPYHTYIADGIVAHNGLDPCAGGGCK